MFIGMMAILIVVYGLGAAFIWWMHRLDEESERERRKEFLDD